MLSKLNCNTLGSKTVPFILVNIVNLGFKLMISTYSLNVPQMFSLSLGDW